MLAIFFPHLFEEVEYLIGADDPFVDASGPSGPSGGSNSRRHASENAVAGPSRLH